MITHLTIAHYALIEHLDIDFRTGFTVVTGETGAGKSIMLGALSLLLGGRADARAIQTGQKKCLVEATFSIDGLGLEPFFTENDIDYDASECIVRREVSDTGKSRAFINDTPTTAARLRELGTALIDIHSQHQNLLIRNEHFLIDTLDTLAADAELLGEYKERYQRHREAEKRLRELEEQAQKGRDDQEYLQFQLQQIDDAAPKEGEQEELEQEQNLLGHAEEIKGALYGAKTLLASDETSLAQCLRQAADRLRQIAEHMPETQALAERLESARIEIEDIEGELDTRAERIDYDPARLAFVEERLSTLYTLEQKHHLASLEELLQLAEDLRARLAAIENVDEDIRRQKDEADRLRAERNETAARLTAERQKAARQMADELTAALQELGMPNVRIDVRLTPRTEPDATGADSVAFLFSANKNAALQDVAQIASGGEIARLMLALKALIARRTALPTIVFDEIDTGVSGTMAESMARVMQQIARTCQVVCITHLPQIAALGAHHFRVYKEDTADTTLSHIVPLTPEERVEEIAHMLSGTALTDAAKENAKALLAAGVDKQE